MIAQRVLAELVDIIVNLGLLVFEVIVILPLYDVLQSHPFIYIICSIGTFYALIILVQGLFWNNGESIGKYFMRLELAHKDPEKNVTFEMMIAREFFVKYITLYFSSIPLLFGKEAIQDKVTETVVRRKNVEAKV